MEPAVDQREHGRCVGLGGGGIVAAMEPAGDRQEHASVPCGHGRPGRRAAMEPAGDQREYRNHHPGSRRAAIAAMEAACNRREH